MGAAVERRKPRRAEPEEIALVHSPDYVEAIRRFAAAGGGYLDPDTVVSLASYEAAAVAAGAALDAVDAILAGDGTRAFLAVRPPGHHALPGRAMGFCLFNNIAIAARYLQKLGAAERILIADFDCHHGNGTQAVFYSDPDVYYVSIHLYPFYPGTGAAGDAGEGPGEGTNVNIPVGWGADGGEVVRLFADAVEKAAARCEPEFVLVSAGFDGCSGDPIAGMGLEPDDFAALTRPIVRAAESYAGGRVISTLEGGYNLDRLGECVIAHLAELGGKRIG